MGEYIGHSYDLRATIITDDVPRQRLGKELLNSLDFVFQPCNLRNVRRFHAQRATTVTLEAGQERSVVGANIDAESTWADGKAGHDSVGKGALIDLKWP